LAEFLSQEEIDALLNENSEKTSEATLSAVEDDALGEIGNISMGSAATTLSQILNKRVSITTPKIKIMTRTELFASFQIPYVLVEVNFTSGLEGTNLLIIKVTDAAVIADLMMGGSGEDVAAELDEIKSSAVAEAMNQMIASAATSMSTIFQRSVKISPPSLKTIDFSNESYTLPWQEDQMLAVVNFRMEVENLIDSQIMQVIPVETAKAETSMLLSVSMPDTGSTPGATVPELTAKATTSEYATSSLPQAPPVQTTNETRKRVYGSQARNIDLILDVPLDVEVILGTAVKHIQEILKLAPGAIVELDRLVDEPVDITVNGTPIARGEVVVVNENFGVRITHILEPYERINQLRHPS